MNRLFASTFVLIVAVVCAAPASAAVRYASPAGLANANCPIATPCDLTSAVNSTAFGDEVILLSGVYNVAPTTANTPGISTAQDVTIRGESPFDPPLINTAPTDGSRGFVVNYGVTLRDVRISYLGANATNVALYAGQLTTVERVHVDAGTVSYSACSTANGSKFLNTACIAHGNGAPALNFSIGMNSDLPLTWDFTAETRNSTFVSVGDSATGAVVLTGNQGTAPLTLRINAFNTIFESIGASSVDLRLTTQYGANNTAEVNAQNSNFSTVVASGGGTESCTLPTSNGNQEAAPIFNNVATGDLTQAPSSPTIDAGFDDAANGTLDLAAKPRIAGARTDIGAYEFQPPVMDQPQHAISALKSDPSKFRAAASGATLRPASARPKLKRGQKPTGSLLSLESTDAGELNLYAFRALKGRKNRAGKCGKPSHSNVRGKRCTYYKKLSRSASSPVAAGPNTFYFTGRWNGKKLLPGRYLLVAKHAGKGPSVPTPTATEVGVAKRNVSIVR